jgi:hypothetical protein
MACHFYQVVEGGVLKAAASAGFETQLGQYWPTKIGRLSVADRLCTSGRTYSTIEPDLRSAGNGNRSVNDLWHPVPAMVHQFGPPQDSRTSGLPAPEACWPATPVSPPRLGPSFPPYSRATWRNFYFTLLFLFAGWSYPRASPHRLQISSRNMIPKSNGPWGNST